MNINIYSFLSSRRSWLEISSSQRRPWPWLVLVTSRWLRCSPRLSRTWCEVRLSDCLCHFATSVWYSLDLQLFLIANGHRWILNPFLSELFIHLRSFTYISASKHFIHVWKCARSIITLTFITHWPKSNKNKEWFHYITWKTHLTL